MEKKISYLARNFSDIQSELINFSNKYYPEMATTFQDKSVGSWFIDLCASVGDDLSYSIDRAFQETQINSANLKSSVLNLARENGIKVPGSKASICEVAISCTLPIDANDISSPNWDYSPIIKRASTVACGIYSFEIQEDVNFREQFNNDGYSNRTFIPRKNTNGIITAYTVTKLTMVSAGTSKVYKKAINSSDLSPFMEIVLPEQNVMNIDGIIFKADSNYDKSPNLSEYFVGNEEYKWADESIYTYKYFEVDSLSDQYIFGAKMSNTVKKDASGNTITSEINGNPIYNCSEVYDTYTMDGDIFSKIYKGEWKAIKQKYITEYTDNGYLKIIFGSGNNYEDIPKSASTYSKWEMSKLVNNDMLGILPEAGWTMYCLYKVGGGIGSNVAENSINKFTWLNSEWNCTNLDTTIQSYVLNSIAVTNPTAAIAGKDSPSTEELKYIIKYAIGSQERCVTLKDYKSKLMMMPPKFGAPFRASVSEDNNKILMHLLTINNDGTLSNKMPSTLTDNISEYMKMYKSMNDYIEILSGKIINLGFIVSVFIDKTYNTGSVVKTIINTITNYLDINKHDMGDELFIGDLEKEITLLDGVISIIEFEVYNLYSINDDIYGYKSGLPKYIDKSENICGDGIVPTYPNIENSFRIDLDSIDSVLTSDNDSMFEIKNKVNDIKIKVKLK